MATVTVEFEVRDDATTVALADRLFASEQVVTVRIGGPGERSVYRVDMPEADVDVAAAARAPALSTARCLGIDVRFVRVGITADGRGDPDQAPLTTD